MSSEQEWDYSFDVVVVGSGNGGMTAALCTYEMGRPRFRSRRLGAVRGQRQPMAASRARASFIRARCARRSRGSGTCCAPTARPRYSLSLRAYGWTAGAC